MNISKHLHIAGAIQVALGVLGLPFGLGLVLLTVRNIRRNVGFGWEHAGVSVLWLPALVLALVLLAGGIQIWFGCSLAKQKRWATRVFGFIWCGLGLFSFPIGTVINGYTLWILIRLDKMEAKRGAEPTVRGDFGIRAEDGAASSAPQP